MKNFKNLKKELLKDKETKRLYDDLSPEFDVIHILMKKREKMGLTQKELAEKTGTKQSAIARFESGNYNPSLSFINKIARGLDAKIDIRIK